jgi:predicted DNA-binding transcriptional regulator YafY
VSTAHLAQRLGVGHRTVERDLARLRESGATDSSASAMQDLVRAIAP